ncbi:MAG: hypothetical protein ACK6DC_11795, partial [Planctomycetota bacterium]
MPAIAGLRALGLFIGRHHLWHFGELLLRVVTFEVVSVLGMDSFRGGLESEGRVGDVPVPFLFRD